MVGSRRGASARAPRVSLKSVETNRILIGDCIAEMAKLPAESVDLVFAEGQEILAAYLTMPGWLAVAWLSLLPSAGSPIEAALSSWFGNLVLLTLSASLNVAVAYIVARAASMLR